MTDENRKDIDWLAVFVFATVALIGLALVLYASGAGTGFVYDNV